MVKIHKNNKIFLSIILGLFLFNFFIGIIAFHINNEQDDTTIERTILFSLDSCNSEYMNRDWLPKIYGLLKDEGVVYKTCWASIASETQLGHTTMLTGCHPSSSGVIGNGLYINETGETVGVLQDPKWRMVKTVFEHLNDVGSSMKTGFVSGKWRLPKFLAFSDTTTQEADFVIASPVTGIPLPAGYEARVGTPITYIDGDMYDQYTMRALTELVENDDPDFIFVNLAWLDVSGHDTGSFNINHKRELSQLDDMLFQFINDLKAMNKYKTTLMVFTGDHGMDSILGVFNPESFLESNGIEVHHLHGEGHSAFIFLKDQSDKENAVKLLEANENVAVVLPREEMDQLHLDTLHNRTGDIYMSCKETIAVSVAGFSLGSIGTHGGVSSRDVPLAFIGPRIIEGEFVQDLIPGIEDIVPTLLELWGEPIPSYIDGRVLNEIIE